MITEFTDDTIMPFWKFKGKKMKDIPKSYKKWMYDKSLCTGPLRAYLEKNYESYK